ncbi:hypothetical protein DYB26_008845 [Aphanomyces astaci]|uniref:Cytochrome b5 heme-binding domain-containing protein n=1 Tax=Aphanomyces astaci TaxID=112090 RepID=A0A397DS04_APHAT|nr:hypothetical protein DYB36_002857 [Aphanomyces astaci]RHY70269.1 hypothetical protein DYB38_003737 [Aphanomyces astaci]RHZ09998.1 hypothetical protein DYB26_008845 [Aphanomyces astaci]RHZ19967.1 hypothetical protein DYB31_011471 [Aphanomyces astaci]
MTGGHGVRRNISREEIAQHNTEQDCWTILDGKVYNLTPYLRYHPGGVGKLMLSAGGDCTTLFNESHAWVNGHGMLEVQWYMCLYPYVLHPQVLIRVVLARRNASWGRSSPPRAPPRRRQRTRRWCSAPWSIVRCDFSLSEM